MTGRAMPEYAYVAVGPDGRRRRGTATAASEDALAGELRQRREYLLEAGRTGVPSGLASVRLFERVTRRDVIFLTSQLSAVVGAGVNLVEGLRDIEAQAAKAPLKAMIADVRRGVERGLSLSSALDRHPKAFGDLYVSIVRAGETTGNRMCSSGQQAVHFAAQEILAEDMDIVIAGGTEMLSHQPIGSDWPASWPVDFPYELVHQGISAEMMAEKWALSREELDDFSFLSHQHAMHAIQNGYFEEQLLPVARPDGRLVNTDEGVRMPPDRQKIGSLKPVFKEDGVITAGNSSQVSDGAASLVLASARAVGRYNLDPIARIVTRVVIGSDPVIMLDGPIPATRMDLKKATAAAAKRQESLGMPAVLLVPGHLRWLLSRFLRRASPSLKVLANAEIPDSRTIKVTTLIGAKA